MNPLFRYPRHFRKLPPVKWPSLPSGGGVIGAIIRIVCYGICFYLLYWLIGFVKLPEPFNKVALVVMAVAGVILLIREILTLAGSSSES